MELLSTLVCWLRSCLFQPVVFWEYISEIEIPQPRFGLGMISVGAKGVRLLHCHDVARALERHANKDWGEVYPLVAAANEVGSRTLGRIISRYRDRHGRAFMVITEGNRKMTNVWLE